MKEYAIIVAGGKGTRLKSSVPKQFLLLAGQPILLHTIEAFYRYSEKITVILVLPETDLDTWNAIVRDYHFLRPVILQQGGDSRFQSVKRGLEKIEGDGLVAIHDGVRPLINSSIIASSFQLAATHKSAVAAMPLKESIRMTNGETSKAMDRSRYQLIQTPQTFDVNLIQSAYRVTEEATLTDDASVAERSGHTIHLFEGSYENIKITTPEDLIIAEALMAARQC